MSSAANPSDNLPVRGDFAGRPASTKLGRLIVVDDEVELLSVLCERLNNHGYEATGFSSPTAALQALHEREFDLLLTDLMMPDMDGLTLVRAAQEANPYLVGVVMTGQGTIQTAVEALKLGATDFVLKPFKMQLILPVLARALEVRRLRLENLQLRETVAVHDLCRAISYSLDLNTLLNKIVDAALQQCEADEVSLMLPTPDGNELYVGAAQGAGRACLPGERVPLTGGLAGWVARQQRPLVLQGDSPDPGFELLRPRSDVRTAAAFPLLVGGKLVGVLNVHSTRHQAFTLGQMKALTFLTSAGAAAIESAQLYDEVTRAEREYRSIFESVVEGIFRIAPTGRFILANPAMARMLGFPSPEALLNLVTDVERDVFLDPERWAAERSRLEADSPWRQLEHPMRRTDGSTCWVWLNVRAARDATGAVSYYEGTAVDITQQKQAEAALRETNQALRALVQAAPLPIFTTDLETRVKTWNPAAERLFGWKEHEILGSPLPIVPPQKEEEFRQNLARLLAGEPILGLETQRQRRDGSCIEVSLSASALTDSAGTINGFMVILRDISERKLLEEQLRQAQKMEAVGRLAGGVAHDFNNLLTVINGYGELLLLRSSRAEPTRGMVEEIVRSGRRAAELTQQLLAFSRKQILRPQVLDLNATVADAERMLRRLIGEDIELVTSPEPGLGRVSADPGQLQQMLLNLAVNARDAMPTGGKLTVETRNAELTSGSADMELEVRPGPYVLLTVSDTGCGMTEEVKARIFEPFFTTKGVGKGTGLGLATVYGAVKQAGGNISVDSEPGRGTTFKVYLPRVEDAVAETAEPAAAPAPRGVETVLVVEDEGAVRGFTASVLRERGYVVLVAEDGLEALRQAEDHQGPIDLLVTDVVMPRMGGRALAESLRAVRPSLRVLYVSGYADDSVLRDGPLAAETNFLHKPFGADVLASKVREVLDRPVTPAADGRRSPNAKIG